MKEQTVFKAGNSNVVAIPQNLLRSMGLKRGSKVVIEAAPTGEAFVVRKADKGKLVSNRAASAEFKKWLAQVLEEDGKVLDELAVR